MVDGMKIGKTSHFVVTVETSQIDWTGHFKEEPDVQEIEQAVYLDIDDLEVSALNLNLERASLLRTMLEVVRVADLRGTDIYVGGTWVGKITIEDQEIYGRIKESMMPEWSNFSIGTY